MLLSNHWLKPLVQLILRSKILMATATFYHIIVYLNCESYLTTVFKSFTVILLNRTPCLIFNNASCLEAKIGLEMLTLQKAA